MSAYLLNKLHQAVVDAVLYVSEDRHPGWHPGRERAALKALDAAFEAAHDGRAADIVFRLQETTECPSPTP